MNVYNCTKPGKALVGYDRLRSEITEDAIAGKSFAILGGRRCGKTSLLLQLQADLQRSNDANRSERKILVPFLDLQSLGQVTAAVLFRSLYEGTTRGVSVAAWPSCALTSRSCR